MGNVVAGVVIVMFGIALGAGMFVWSKSDWAWEHNNSAWRAPFAIKSSSRQTQVRIWQGGSILLGVMVVCVGAWAIVH
jgi:hypothetical protein